MLSFFLSAKKKNLIAYTIQLKRKMVNISSAKDQNIITLVLSAQQKICKKIGRYSIRGKLLADALDAPSYYCLQVRQYVQYTAKDNSKLETEIAFRLEEFTCGNRMIIEVKTV